jgi:hypothetical protein
VRTPLVRGGDGELAPATWDEAFAAVAEGLRRVQAAGGRDAVAAYVGNPSAHGVAALTYGRVLLRALGTRNVFLGLHMTAPNVRGRLRASSTRGGEVVVVDPRRTRTAAEADEHLAIRPGTDALLLFALVRVVLAEDLGPELDPARASRPVGAATACARRPGASSSRRRRSWPAWSASMPRSTRRRPTSSWSAGATCARTPRGCTTCRASCPGGHGARCRSTRTTRRGSAWPTASRRVCRPGRVRSRRPSR